MSAALLQQGRTAIRDSLKTLVTHIAVADGNLAFSLAQTGINPSGGSTSTHVEAATKTDVDVDTFDATISITGTTEFTDKTIFTIGIAKGLAVRQVTGSGGVHTGGGTVGTDTLSRSVRTLGIGVQAGDVFTVGVRVAVADNS